jgi:activating signal cointegrator complex subunit 3
VTRQDGVDFLSWTYFFRRLARNPAYYHLEVPMVAASASSSLGLDEAGSLMGSFIGSLMTSLIRPRLIASLIRPRLWAVNTFLSDLIEGTLYDLQSAGCLEIDEIDGSSVRPLTLGRVASYYYLKYTTVALFCAELHDVDEAVTELPTLLRVLCDASEFDELPVLVTTDEQL